MFDGDSDAVWGDGGGKVKRSVSEVNLVHGYFITFSRPVLQWSAYLPFGPATSSPIPACVPSGLVRFILFFPSNSLIR
jgi:hypothetical protein